MPIQFTYWSDPLCIWAYVAQDKLDRILGEYGEQLKVAYRIVPVFGSVPWRFKYGPWAAQGIEGRVRATQRIAQEHGHPEVSGEVWRQSPASSWSPGAAIKAVFALEESEGVPVGSGAAYQIALRKRFFAQDGNVACRDEQLAVAEQMQLPRAPIEAALDDGSAMAALWEDHYAREELKIQGSPTYVFDEGRARLYGNFPYAILHATVQAMVAGMGPGASEC